MASAGRNPNNKNTAMEITYTDIDTARREGFRHITTPYRPFEMWMLKNALKDMANVPHRVVLVPVKQLDKTVMQPEIWRKRNELLGDFVE